MASHLFELHEPDAYAAWTKGILWLSLDRVAPFWPDVGLWFSNAEAAKSAARAALRAKKAIDDADNDDPDYVERLKALDDTLLHRIAETSGAPDAARVVAWLEGPVRAAQREPVWHRTWRILLCRMPAHDPALIASGYRIPRETTEQLFEIAARYRQEDDAIDARVEAADQEDLSGWDAEAYEEYRREGPDLSPLDGLGIYLKCLRFDEIWQEILRLLSPADLDALVRWGRALLVLCTTIPGDAANIPDHARSLS